MLERGLDAVLDPQTQAMATVGGYAKGMDGLPWSKKRPHALEDLATAFQQRQMAEDIAKFAIQHGFTQVITPTAWNIGPRDGSDNHGPMEKAFIGAPVENPDFPVELAQVAHSYDSCLVCTVHAYDGKTGRELAKFRMGGG